MPELNFELLAVWKYEKSLPKINFFGYFGRFHLKWDKILEILTFNSARILKLTYAPRSAAFIHLPFIAGIFQPQDFSGKFAGKKEEKRSVLDFVYWTFILCSVILSQGGKTKLSVDKSKKCKNIILNVAKWKYIFGDKIKRAGEISKFNSRQPIPNYW